VSDLLEKKKGGRKEKVKKRYDGERQAMTVRIFLAQ